MTDVVQNQGPEKDRTVSGDIQMTSAYVISPLVVDHAHPTVVLAIAC